MLKFKASASDSQIARTKSSAGDYKSGVSSSTNQLSEGANSTLEQLILQECQANFVKEQLKRKQKDANHGDHHSDSGCSGGGSPPNNAIGNEGSSMNTSLQDVPVHHGRLSRGTSNVQDYMEMGTPVPKCGNETDLDFDTTCASFVVEDDSMKMDSYPKLADIPYAPWGEHEVLNVLREGRTLGYSGNITVEMMQKLSTLLQRPLTRIAREARRLSQTFLHCTKHEMQTAMKIVLSCSLFRSALQGASKAIALHTMGANCLKISKSQRCGLRFSVGRFHRWMVDMEVAPVIDEQAAICFSACMETLLEEIVLKAFSSQKIEGAGIVPVSVLETGVEGSAELWGLLQSFDHLVCGRNASGMVCLPDQFVLDDANYLCETPKPLPPSQTISGQKQSCAVEFLLTTGATSQRRLATVMDEALVQWNASCPRGGRTISTRGRDGPRPNSLGPSLHWSRDAKQELWHYMKTSRCITNQGMALKLSPLHSNTPADEQVYTLSPPLVEWIRVAASFAEHRRCHVIDADDVRQAARVILPKRKCGTRFFGPIDPANFPRASQLKQHLELAQQHALAELLLSPDTTYPLSNMGASNINTCDIQGLTPLMYACVYGDQTLVSDILSTGAECNVKVSTEYHKYPYVHPELRNWTSLNFAVIGGCIPILKMLLMNGAHIEGASYGFSDNHSITPLQLAAACGNLEVTSWLLSQGADPYLRTSPKAGMAVAECQHGFTAFTLAAMHGHRHVVKKLLAQPIKSGYEVLSLCEILAEGKPDKRTSLSSIQNEYQTIDEVFKEIDPKKSNNISKSKTQLRPNPRFTELQMTTLQEALYHASENGHLDLALDIRQMGIYWTPHAWSKCLETAHYLQRKAVVKGLLTDFTTCSLDDLTMEFVFECLPLLFEILKEGKVEIISQQVAMVLSSLYGKATIPPIAELRRQMSTRIDPKFVNNPDLSDVHFIIEGKTFYAHKLLLATASNRFKTMLSGATKDGKIPTIELGDIKYHIFEKMMDYLYNGGMCYIHMDTKTLMELYGAAHFFHLESLQRHCERMFSKSISMDNCVAIYKIGKLYSSISLLSFCEAYFLQNFQKALLKNKIFRELLFSTRLNDFDLIDGLLATLSQRVEDRITEKQKPKSSMRQ